MQMFLFAALLISLIAIVFALQNIVPVTVTFVVWTFQGSLALVLIAAMAVGALISFLASVPSLVRHRWTTGQLRKQVASLEANLEASRLELAAKQGRPDASAPDAGHSHPRPSTDTPGSTLEPSA